MLFYQKCGPYTGACNEWVKRQKWGKRDRKTVIKGSCFEILMKDDEFGRFLIIKMGSLKNIWVEDGNTFHRFC